MVRPDRAFGNMTKSEKRRLKKIALKIGKAVLKGVPLDCVSDKGGSDCEPPRRPVERGHASLNSDDGAGAPRVAALSLLHFVEAYLGAEERLWDAAEIAREPSPSCCPSVTDPAIALRVACRLAAGKPAWERFDSEQVVEVGGYRVTLTPDSEGDGSWPEVLRVEDIDAGAGDADDGAEDEDDPESWPAWTDKDRWRPSGVKGDGPGHAILRTAAAEYRRCLAKFEPGCTELRPLGETQEERTEAVRNLDCVGQTLGYALMQVHGCAHDDIPAAPIAAEVCGLLVTYDPTDGLERGVRVHVVDVSNVVRIG